MRFGAVALALLILVLVGPVAGCGDDDPGGTDALKGLVSLEISGGFAGLMESVVVEPDGAVTIARGRRSDTATLSDDDLAALARDLQASGLFTEDREFRGRGADLRTYTITYDGATVTVDEGAVPAELTAVVERLEGLGP